MSRKKNTNVIYDKNVDYKSLVQHTYKDSPGDVSLVQHTYKDSPGDVFYTCPICGGEYLATFIVEECGQTMCIGCWNKRYGS